jgi:hypothetical protein
MKRPVFDAVYFRLSYIDAGLHICCHLAGRDRYQVLVWYTAQHCLIGTLYCGALWREYIVRSDVGHGPCQARTLTKLQLCGKFAAGDSCWSCELEKLRTDLMNTISLCRLRYHGR